MFLKKIKNLFEKTSKFECKYCSKEFEFENNVLKHEKTCKDNPNYKSPRRISKKAKKLNARRETKLRNKLKILQSLGSDNKIEELIIEIKEEIKRPLIREKKYHALMEKAQKIKEKKDKETIRRKKMCTDGYPHDWEQKGGPINAGHGWFKKIFVCRKCKKMERSFS